MKNDLTTTLLNLLLAVLVLLSVGFTLLIIRREPKLPAATADAVRVNNTLREYHEILKDATAYNNSVHDADLAHILQAAQSTSAAR